MEPVAEAWTALIRWRWRGVGLIRVWIPCGCPRRAAWLARHLRGGSVKGGTVQLGGMAIPRALERLGQPRRLCDAAWRYARAAPGAEKVAAVDEIRRILGDPRPAPWALGDET